MAMVAPTSEEFVLSLPSISAKSFTQVLLWSVATIFFKDLVQSKMRFACILYIFLPYEVGIILLNCVNADNALLG